MSSVKGIHFFPGHMKKYLNNIGPLVKSVDIVVEIVDSRAPESTRNPLLNSLIENKPRVILMSKKDLSDPVISSEWSSYYSSQGHLVLASSLKEDKVISLLKEKASPIISKKRAKEAKIGMKPQPIRIMVLGVPNVGKSTFINNLVGKKKVVVGNKAGVTRGEQWVKVSDDFTLLDTPGVLPMNYDDKNTAIRLALLGNMKEEILPTEELAEYFLDYLRTNYPSGLKDRFSIDNLTSIDNNSCLLTIASKRGLLDGANPSIEKASYLLIKEFKDGILGKISLEKPNNA